MEIRRQLIKLCCFDVLFFVFFLTPSHCFFLELQAVAEAASRFESTDFGRATGVQRGERNARRKENEAR